MEAKGCGFWNQLYGGTLIFKMQEVTGKTVEITVTASTSSGRAMGIECIGVTVKNDGWNEHSESVQKFDLKLLMCFLLKRFHDEYDDVCSFVNDLSVHFEPSGLVMLRVGTVPWFFRVFWSARTSFQSGLLQSLIVYKIYSCHTQCRVRY